MTNGKLDVIPTPFDVMHMHDVGPNDVVSVSDIHEVQMQEQNTYPTQLHTQSTLLPETEEDQTVTPPIKKPTTLMVVSKIQDQPGQRKLLKVLLDSGSDKTMIHRRCLPKGATPFKLATPQIGNTLAGNLESTQGVWLQDLVLPEFGSTRRIQTQKALVFDGNLSYDAILGLDFLTPTGIDICLSDQTIRWLGKSVPMKGREYWDDPIQTYLTLNPEDEDASLDGESDAFVTALRNAKYEETSPLEVARQQRHLNTEQQNKLAAVLTKYQKLFSNKLKVYPHKKVHLDLLPNSQPVHSHPYTVPHINEKVFKEELEHLCAIGVLKYAGASEWAAPTMGIPKKDGRIRIVSDFRALNKCIRRKVFPLPNINEMLRKRPGYEFLTKLDISMQYYTFELDEESQDLCTIITPFGKYKYCRLPMGIKCSPDIAQEVMTSIFRDLDDVSVFIDDIGAFSNSFDEHLKLLDVVLRRLEDNNFCVNPLKCEWCIKETDYLGYWMTPKGLKPWRKKIEAIQSMQPPTNVSELRSFLGAVGYYHDMFPHRSHILAPLTNLTGSKGPIHWTVECDKAFKQMKALLAEDVLLAYPDPNQPFHVYTDASDYQLGAVIMQNNRPVAYYSRKLTSAQMNYTVMEKELLSIVETLKAYRNMLYGCRELHVHTDHKNLTYTKLNSRRVLRWRLLLEDFNPIFHYIKGPHNVIADSLSRLRIKPFASMEEKSPDSKVEMEDDEFFLAMFLHHPDVLSMEASGNDGAHFDCASVEFDCYPTIDCPLPYNNIRQHQLNDATLMNALQNKPLEYEWRPFDGVQLVCKNVPTAPNAYKICIPNSLVNDVIVWYHETLGHVGESRLFTTINTHMTCPLLYDRVALFCSLCHACKVMKLPGKGYGHHAPRMARLLPFQEIATDTIGPWTIHLANRNLTFMALSFHR